MSVGLVKRAHTVLLAAEKMPLSHIAKKVGLTQKPVRQWITHFIPERIAGLYDRAGRGRKPSFSLEVVLHAVKMAWERPDVCGRSLWVWDCEEIARQLMKEAIAPAIRRESVRKRRASHRLKPWRYRRWLSAKVPRDQALRTAVEGLCALYTRLLLPICTNTHCENAEKRIEANHYRVSATFAFFASYAAF
jgi:hypothetical protein